MDNFIFGIFIGYCLYVVIDCQIHSKKMKRKFKEEKLKYDLMNIDQQE